MEGWTLTDEGWSQREVERVEKVGVQDLENFANSKVSSKEQTPEAEFMNVQFR